jgi:hypothetical protein
VVISILEELTTSIFRVEDQDKNFLKTLVTPTKLHDIITQKTTVHIFITVETSDLTWHGNKTWVPKKTEFRA